MITLRDLFKTTWTITRVELTVRDEQMKLLCNAWFGKDCDRDHISSQTLMAYGWSKGTLILSDRKINVHGDADGRGQPAMGWGYKEGSIPKQLMDAEITHLGMHCADGIEYTVFADVILPAMTMEIIKTQQEADDEG